MKQKKTRDINRIKRIVSNLLLGLFFFAMFVMFPFVLGERYYQVSFIKWRFFLIAGSCFVFLGVINLLVFALIEKKNQKRKEKKKTIKELLDAIPAPVHFVLLFVVLSTITFAGSENKMISLFGVEGWYMGFVTHILLAMIFLCLVCFRISEKTVILMALIGSSICYCIGIIQRLGFDPFWLYYSMPDEIIRDNLSTLGNRSWYAGYASTMFPLGMYLFMEAKTYKERILFGGYVTLAFTAILTMNTDSVYVALLVIFALLLFQSIGKRDKMLSFSIMVFSFFLSAFVIVFVQSVFPDSVYYLRGVSKILLNRKFSPIPVLLSGLAVLLLFFFHGKKELSKTIIRTIQVSMIGILILVAFVYVGFVALNTSGLLETLTGRSFYNSWVYLDENFGDKRFFNWLFALDMFKDMTFAEKLIGIGQDSFALRAYSNAAYVKRLQGFYPGQILVNAHNEWMNCFLCNGLLGGISYLAIFLSTISMIITYQKKRIRKEKGASEQKQMKRPEIAVAVTYSILAYMVNNFFGYQQITAVVPIFILMGIAVSAVKHEIDNKKMY